MRGQGYGGQHSELRFHFDSFLKTSLFLPPCLSHLSVWHLSMFLFLCMCFPTPINMRLQAIKLEFIVSAANPQKECWCSFVSGSEWQGRRTWLLTFALMRTVWFCDSPFIVPFLYSHAWSETLETCACPPYTDTHRLGVSLVPLQWVPVIRSVGTWGGRRPSCLCFVTGLAQL
jgi:hypothetical protein